VVKKSLRKILVAFVLICAFFALGFAGGFYFSRMASGMDEENGKKEISRAYPIYELGEFKLSLPGNEFTDPALVSFELVLELEDEKVLKRLNEEEYWKALFRNEVISESLSRGQSVFRDPEKLLTLTMDLASRLNESGPSFSKINDPVRRILLKSFVMQ